VEDRPAELDQREVGAVARSNRASVIGRIAPLGRSGRSFSPPVSAIALLASLLLLSAAAVPADEHAPSVRGKLVVQGKSFSFAHVWLVRGPETGDETKPAAYLILSSKDLSASIAACPTIRCVLWDTVQEAAVLEPLDERAESFWLRVVSSQLPKEYQLSGRRWTPTIQTHDRLAGKLQFSYANTRDEADLDLDATLIKEFPVRPGS
jgi:hypothetical protein